MGPLTPTLDATSNENRLKRRLRVIHLVATKATKQRLNTEKVINRQKKLVATKNCGAKKTPPKLVATKVHPPALVVSRP